MTLAEALSAILWAGTAALAAMGTWFAIAPAIIAVLALAVIWLIKPKSENAA